ADVLGSDRGELLGGSPCRGWRWLGRWQGRGSRDLLAYSGKLAFEFGYSAVLLRKPCRNFLCSSAVERHGNKGLSLIGGKIAAFAVVRDAIAAFRGRGLLRLVPGSPVAFGAAWDG